MFLRLDFRREFFSFLHFPGIPGSSEHHKNWAEKNSRNSPDLHTGNSRFSARLDFMALFRDFSVSQNSRKHRGRGRRSSYGEKLKIQGGLLSQFVAKNVRERCLRHQIRKNERFAFCLVPKLVPSHTYLPSPRHHCIHPPIGTKQLFENVYTQMHSLEREEGKREDCNGRRTDYI